MTKQEIFDKVVKGLAGQGFERAIRGHVCVYLAPDGKKCAAGHLIPDGHPAQGLVSKAWSDVVLMYQDLSHGKELDGFIMELQEAHDGGDRQSSLNLQLRLRRVGKAHGLTLPLELQ